MKRSGHVVKAWFGLIWLMILSSQGLFVCFIVYLTSFTQLLNYTAECVWVEAAAGRLVPLYVPARTHDSRVRSICCNNGVAVIAEC